MSGMLDVRVTDADLPDALKLFDMLGARMEKVLARTVNKVIKGVGTDFGREVPKSYGVKKKDVSRALTFRKAAVRSLEARLVSKGSPIPLGAFSALPKKPGTRPTRGVSVKVMGSRKHLTGYFVAGVETGHIGTSHVGVFRRVRETRLPIKQAYGPSISQMLGNPEISGVARDQAMVRFRKVLPQEINFELQKMGLR